VWKKGFAGDERRVSGDLIGSYASNTRCIYGLEGGLCFVVVEVGLLGGGNAKG